MKNIIYILIITLFISSCSTPQKFRLVANREPASLSSFNAVTQSCISNLKYFLKGQNTNERFFKARQKLIDGQDLSYFERRALANDISHIPFPELRDNISKKILKSVKLTDEELKHFNFFIASKYDLPRVDNKLFKKQFLAGDENIPLTYGLEVEMSLVENPNIVDAYRIKNIPEQKWITMSKEERLAISKEYTKKYTDVDELFIKLSSAHSAFPDHLIKEPHGTVEMNGLVFESTGEYLEFVDEFVKFFGRGYMQGHVAFPSVKQLKGIAGYTVFEADLKQLRTFEKGYRLHLNDPSFTPAKNLVHHSNGPLSDKMRKTILGYEKSLNSGDKIDFSRTKAVNGPNFRQDSPYPVGFAGFELRQFHRSYEGLNDAMVNLGETLEHYGSLDAYKPFESTELISTEVMRKTMSSLGYSQDNIDDVELYFEIARDAIIKEIKKVDGVFQGADTSERFLTPLRNWVDHPVLLSLPKKQRSEVKKQIQKSTKEYIEAILEKTKNAQDGILTEADIKDIQVLNSKWGHDTNLSQYFIKYQKYLANRAGNKFNYNYHTLPVIKGLEKLNEADLGGKMVSRYKYQALKAGTDEQRAYSNLVNNSVEIMYKGEGAFGHVNIRVGDKVYDSFTNHIRNFSPRHKPETRGFMYVLDKGEMKSIQKYLDNMFTSIKNTNIPPFTAHDDVFEIRKGKNGRLFFENHQGNKVALDGKVFKRGESYYIKSNTGFTYPLEGKKDGKYLIKSVNCTTSSMQAFKSVFGYDLGRGFAGAHMLNSSMFRGSAFRQPDAIIEYDQNFTEEVVEAVSEVIEEDLSVELSEGITPVFRQQAN